MDDKNVEKPCKGGTPLRKKGLIADSYLPLDLVIIRSERTTSYFSSASKSSKAHPPLYHRQDLFPQNA